MKRYNVFRASNAGGCLRNLYYTHFEGQAPISDTLQKIFDDGTKIHEEQQKKYQLEYPFCECEKEVNIRLSNELSISGHADIYFPNPSLVIELKSCSKTPTKPYTQHSLQVIMYMYALFAKYGNITYINKKDYTHKIFNVIYSDNLFLTAIGFFEKLYYHIIQKEIPDCSCIYGQSFYCKQQKERG